MGHGLSSCTPAGALLAASAAFCTTGDVLASCVPTGASHVLLLAYCMYVVLKLLRSALRVYEAPLVSCARAGVLHLGIPIRPCCVTVTMLLCLCIPPSKGVATSGRPGSLHTCEYSVGMYVLGASTGLLRACDYIVYLPINGIA